MRSDAQITFRTATAADTEAVASLHADSWRRHYRGALSDAFLDDDVFADRLDEWTHRLAQPDPGARTILAEEGNDLVGFIHVIFDEDPTWGSLVDNLHVAYDRKRLGTGARLLAEAARAVSAHASSPGLFLWVLEMNTAAQAFYSACGGEVVERKEEDAHGGGRIIGLRVVWPDAHVLIARARAGGGGP